jgi:hypothetical protein
MFWPIFQRQLFPEIIVVEKSDFAGIQKTKKRNQRNKSQKRRKGVRQNK